MIGPGPSRAAASATSAALAAPVASIALFALLATPLAACTPRPVSDAPDAAASPQASAMPAPLVVSPAEVTSATTAAVSTADAGPPPVPIRGDESLPADSLARETVGYTLSAVFRQADVVLPPRALEVNNAGLEAARKKTELRMAIDLAPARMRITLLGHGWVLPSDTDIRARADRYGHVVVWPGGSTFRPLGPGAMRALLGERRFDVAPITPAEVVTKDGLGKRISIHTRKVEVATRAAKASFDIGHLPELGEGGVLLCRWVLDLMNAAPQSAVCGADELPMRADLHWTSHGSLVFEVTGVLKKTDMSTASLAVPPPGATVAARPFPVAGVAPMLAPEELSALRTSPADGPGAGASEELSVANPSEVLRVLYIDGVPAAWAAPGATGPVNGLLRGRYVFQWRTFLGDEVDAPVTQAVPGALAKDAGAK
jgi:hypothetical protein